ncbi:MAG: response regulator [Pseudomonadota bacterium]
MAEQSQERCLLLVDDEPNILRALSRLLRRDGYTIYTAQSGAEGLALLQEHKVGVIVSDQRMPEMNGTEFLSRVKDIYPDTVRIVLSGYTELSAITDAINRGAIYKFLTKPWDDDLIRENIRAAFAQYEMVDENRRLREQLQAHSAAAAAGAPSVAPGNHAAGEPARDLFDSLPLALAVVKADVIVRCTAPAKAMLHLAQAAPQPQGLELPESLRPLWRQAIEGVASVQGIRRIGTWEQCDVYVGRLTDSTDEYVVLLTKCDGTE